MMADASTARGPSVPLVQHNAGSRFNIRRLQMPQRAHTWFQPLLTTPPFSPFRGQHSSPAADYARVPGLGSFPRETSWPTILKRRAPLTADSPHSHVTSSLSQSQKSDTVPLRGDLSSSTQCEADNSHPRHADRASQTATIPERGSDHPCPSPPRSAGADCKQQNERSNDYPSHSIPRSTDAMPKHQNERSNDYPSHSPPRSTDAMRQHQNERSNDYPSHSIPRSTDAMPKHQNERSNDYPSHSIPRSTETVREHQDECVDEEFFSCDEGDWDDPMGVPQIPKEEKPCVHRSMPRQSLPMVRRKRVRICCHQTPQKIFVHKRNRMSMSMSRKKTPRRSSMIHADEALPKRRRVSYEPLFSRKRFWPFGRANNAHLMEPDAKRPRMSLTNASTKKPTMSNAYTKDTAPQATESQGPAASNTNTTEPGVPHADTAEPSDPKTDSTNATTSLPTKRRCAVFESVPDTTSDTPTHHGSSRSDAGEADGKRPADAEFDDTARAKRARTTVPTTETPTEELHPPGARDPLHATRRRSSYRRSRRFTFSRAHRIPTDREKPTRPSQHSGTDSAMPREPRSISGKRRRSSMHSERGSKTPRKEILTVREMKARLAVLGIPTRGCEKHELLELLRKSSYMKMRRRSLHEMRKKTGDVNLAEKRLEQIEERRNEVFRILRTTCPWAILKLDPSVRRNPDCEKQIKKQFRLISKLCHPDKASDALRARATEAFQMMEKAVGEARKEAATCKDFFVR